MHSQCSASLIKTVVFCSATEDRVPHPSRFFVQLHDILYTMCRDILYTAARNKRAREVVVRWPGGRWKYESSE